MQPLKEIAHEEHHLVILHSRRALLVCTPRLEQICLGNKNLQGGLVGLIPEMG